ncbi:hypothetical protein [Alcanivorax hongdengensis]|nr:hypothetical protein [Alcanivorax hongdengensis]
MPTFQVRIHTVGNGNVVEPNQPFTLTYDVTATSHSDHYYYVDDSLKLVRANSITGSEAGVFSVTYPGGFANGTSKRIRICLFDDNDVPVCDEVRVRAGHVLAVPLAVEMHALGVANQVPANQSLDIHYDVLGPSSSDHYYSVDGELKLVRPQGSQAAGEFSVTYPGGFAAGTSHELKACVQDGDAMRCGSRQVAVGSVGAGADAPAPITSSLLNEHYTVIGNCSPVCGYYENVFYGDSSVSWLPVVGPDSEPNGLRADIYYPTPDGRIHSGSERNTLLIYAHSANHSKESVRADKKGMLLKYLSIQQGGGGVTVAALDFRHPLKDLDENAYPLARDDLSHAVQFFRYYADVFKINPDDIFITGSSLGAGSGIHAAVKELASPDDPSPVRRVSSAIRGAFLSNGQSSFSPQWFRENFLEPAVWPYYQKGYLDDAERAIYGHAVANVTASAPILELVYEGTFVDHKVTLSEYQNKAVDLTHMPNFGLAMLAQYRLHGLDDRIIVRDNYGGNFDRESMNFVVRNRLSGD